MGPYLRRVAAALAGRIIPPGGDIPFAVSQTQCLVFLENYLGELPADAAFGLKALLVAFDLLPLPLIGKPRRFVNLKPEDQDRYLADWDQSRIYWRRMALALLKALFGMGYYNDPKVLAAMGWSAPWEKKRP